MPETRRVVVTSPRTNAPRVPLRWPVTRELDEQTELGTVYVRTLMRAQLWQALRTASTVLAVVVVLPLLLAPPRPFGTARVLGLPLPWVVLGLCVHPIWVWVAVRQVRRAERIEREFTRLVERS
jgi:hypothetical protein